MAYQHIHLLYVHVFHVPCCSASLLIWFCADLKPLGRYIVDGDIAGRNKVSDQPLLPLYPAARVLVPSACFPLALGLDAINEALSADGMTPCRPDLSNVGAMCSHCQLTKIDDAT